MYANKQIITQGLYCASKEDQEITKTIFEELMGQHDFQRSTSKIFGIKKGEEEQTNTNLHYGNDENEGWKIVSYWKERKNKISNSEIGSRKTLARILCKYYPNCKWKSSCWYLHSQKEKKEPKKTINSPQTNISINSCERTMETLCVNDSTDKTKKKLKPASKIIQTQSKKQEKIESLLHIRKRVQKKGCPKTLMIVKTLKLKKERINTL